MMSLPLLAWEMEDEIESPPKRRFVETTESERQDLLNSAKSKRTLISTQTWVKAFGAYCGPKTVDYRALSASDLSERLQGFYTGMRTADGCEYKHASFIAARSALAWYVTTFERQFDLIKGPEFKQANKMLDAVLKDKQQNGREPGIQHNQSIMADSQCQKRSNQRPTTAPRPVAVLSQGVVWWSPRPKRRSWARLNFCHQRQGRRPSFHRNVEHDFRRNYMFTIPCRSFFWSALSLRIILLLFEDSQSRGLSRGFPQVNLFQVLTVWPIFCTKSKPVILEVQAVPQSFSLACAKAWRKVLRF